MTSMAYLARKHGEGLSKSDIASLRKRADGYIKDGYETSEANRSAVEDMMNEVNEDNLAVLKQIQGD